ncbi:MAG: hypothetical protein MUE85_19745 [Microscillaceae bacterium]|jgi:hypothetical protein|nr:hypothetical protein [Microscillaceae bacterium]
MSNYYFYLSFFCLTACGGVSRLEVILQTWKVNKIEIVNPKEKTDSDTLAPELPKKINYAIVYEFRQNGNYYLQNGSRRDSGRWALSSDERVLVLKSATNSVDNSEFLIEELNNYRMLISTENKGKKETIELSPLR